MTLGPQVSVVRRVAGLSAAWGASLDLPVGFTTGTQLRELVRASLGAPVGWNIVGTLEGGAVGDTVQVIAKPGLGQATGLVPLASLSSVVPVTLFPSPGVPATEIVVYVRVPVAMVGAARVTIVACPAAWPHWAEPRRSNP